MIYYREDRAADRDLAALWKPGVPDAQNFEYIARARELNKDLETIFAARFDITAAAEGTAEDAAEDGAIEDGGDNRPARATATGYQSKGRASRR